MLRVRFAALLLLVVLCPTTALAADEPAAATLNPAALNGLKLRSIGPALTSGRVVGLAVHPKDRSHYYVAAASGGVWKTTNAGTSWTPVFDNEGAYSIGAVVLDPKNPETVWVGTGENNSQRSVGYGDGVYRSDDGGKSWRNVGLPNSEHIGKILIDPRNSDVVWVAAQGPLWAPGGDRGLYRTTDGGKTWHRSLAISENTGVTDVVMDPRDPDVMIAAAYQRRRHVWTLINGGPESALYKSTDGGKTWRKLSRGLPAVELGRIGLAVAPSEPDVVCAIVEAADGKGGIFRSTDRGETWERRNPFDQQAQYYVHLVVDPKESNRIYVMNVQIQLSEDGGKTLKPLGQKWMHVDNHCMWIDPKNTNYYLVGCDGGVYESFDRAAHWKFVANLPLTQFYDVTCDESGPFYHVYGGTQDNYTIGAPARNRSVHGITNSDWFVVQGGDGFHCKVDPKDPNIVYAESQYGVLVRFDRKTGEKVTIQPQPGKGEPPLRWNWDSPLVLSPHSNTRLYFAANRVFRSDDRGDSWTPVSGDLTRQLDRDRLPVMGKVWAPDSVAKHLSTSYFGNITALAELPKQEGLLYAGTDDGLIQVTEDNGKTWRKIDKFTGVPEQTFVSRIYASQHDAKTVYAAFDNHKRGDFQPHLLKSTDAGKTWTSLRGDLPERGSVKAFIEDHVDPNLFFVGTEFALYFSADGGKHWVRLKSGLPTICVKDLAIQRKENDLVVGTFGRGIYILDDYSALRGITAEKLKLNAVLFPIKDALQYIPTRQYGGAGKAFLGEAFYTADNPAFGAAFTYHLRDALKTKKERRQEAQRKDPAPPYPTKDDLRAEAEEEAPAILLTVADEKGKPIRVLNGPMTAGTHRVSWDLRLPAATLPRPRPPQEGDDDDDRGPPGGPLVVPGTYQVRLSKRVDGVTTELAGPVKFRVVEYGHEGGDSRKELFAFQEKVQLLERSATAAVSAANDLAERLTQIKKALDGAPALDAKWSERVRGMERANRDILRALRGDVALRARNENTPTAIVERVRYIASGLRFTLSGPTQTQRDAYRIAGEELTEQQGKLRKLIDVDVKEVEKALDEAGAPLTPGRLPEWKDR